jgi:transposase
MGERAIRQWVPGELWEIVAPLIPPAPHRPQGGGRRRVDDRVVPAAILYLTESGCSWWKLPTAVFGVGRATAHRRFTEWTEVGRRRVPMGGDRRLLGTAQSATSTSPALHRNAKSEGINPVIKTHRPRRLRLPQPRQPTSTHTLRHHPPSPRTPPHRSTPKIPKSSVPA